MNQRSYCNYLILEYDTKQIFFNKELDYDDKLITEKSEKIGYPDKLFKNFFYPFDNILYFCFCACEKN